MSRLSCCRMSDILYELTSMKFQEPSDGEQAIRAHMEAVRTKLTERFRALEEEFR
jgi:V-type H+-transporting ATPase subunit A